MTYTVINNTEAQLAEVFAAKHADTMRYVAETKRWFIKNASGWEPDTKLQALYLVQQICTDAANRSGDPTLAKTLCSSNFIAAVERLCRCQPKLAATKADVGVLTVKKRKPEVSVG